MRFWCLLLFLLMISCAALQAQSSVLEKKISVHYTNKSIAQVIEGIKQKYQIAFSYFENQAGLQQVVTIRMEDTPLREVLLVLLGNHHIHYQAIGGQIVLKKGVSTNNEQGLHKERAHSLSGNSKSNFTEKNEWLFVSNSLPSAKKRKHHGVSSDHTNTSGSSLGEALYEQQEFTSVKYRKAETSNANQFTVKVKYPFKQITYLLGYQMPRPIDLAQKVAQTDVLRLTIAQVPITTNLSKLQMSLLPGIGTHGIHPGEFTNMLSVNMLAGYSAGNRIIEIGGLSNFNQYQVQGVQIGGIANVVGGNKFIGLTKQEKQKPKKDTPPSDLQGFQLAGMTNIIAGNVFGWQTAGGINFVEQSLQGIQIAGVSNLVKTFSFGIQMAGVSNASLESVDGLQVAGLYNYTEGELHGIQISAFNQAGNIEGKHSKISVEHTGLQIGLLNTSERMNGYQFGLVNVAGSMAGTQIGLINLNANKKGGGTPIGLLNLNSKGHFIRLYSSELFMGNAEISTGSLKIQNMLSVGYNLSGAVGVNRPRWGIGYSIGQVKRPSTQYFYSYDAGIAHINTSGKITRELSLLTKLRGTAGYKVQLKKVVFYVFGGLTLNTYVSNGDKLPISPSYLRLYYRNSQRTNIEVWPGFVAGIHI